MMTILLTLLCFSMQGVGLPGAQLPQRPVAPTTDEYQIGPKDIISVTIYGEDAMSRPMLLVDDQGMVDYPYVGLLKVSGLTPRQVEQELKRRLEVRPDASGREQGILRNPAISVTVKEFKSQKVWVHGAVRNPGYVELKGGATLMNALSAENAGPMNPDAGSYVLIIHATEGQATGAATPENARPENQVRVSRHDIDMGLARTIKLRDNDTVFVPTAEKFYVDGEVKTTGPFVLTPDLQVFQALTVAGGVTDRGAKNRITIKRTVNGKTVTIKVKENDLVQPGDTIIVPRKRI